MFEIWIVRFSYVELRFLSIYEYRTLDEVKV